MIGHGIIRNTATSPGGMALPLGRVVYVFNIHTHNYEIMVPGLFSPGG